MSALAPASSVAPETLHEQLSQLTAQIAGRPLDTELQQWLNARFGPGTAVYESLKATCQAGVAAGRLCQREAGGIRFGRVFKPDAALHGFSVDVVDMDDIAGPHHVHPQGEIDLVMPVAGDARFDGHPAGWVVCPPGSGHRPT